MKSSIILLLLVIQYVVIGQTTVGLVAHYNLNNQANDLTVNSNNGIINGTSPMMDRFGNPNGALAFDGVDDFIDCGNILDVSSQTGISISAWLYPGQIIGDGSSFSNFTNCYSGLGFGKKEYGTLMMRVRTSSDPRFQAHHANSGETQSVSMSGDNHFVQNRWYHLVALYSDNGVSLYINDVEQSLVGGSGNNLQNIPWNSIFRIGKSYNSGNVETYFSGGIDDVRIYNRLLTDGEITELFNETNLSLSSADKTLSETKFNVYPNPARNVLSVSGLTEKESEIIVYEISGKLSGKYTLSSSHNEIDISNLARGTYVISFGNLGNHRRLRFVKY